MGSIEDLGLWAYLLPPLLLPFSPLLCAVLFVLVGILFHFGVFSWLVELKEGKRQTQ